MDKDMDRKRLGESISSFSLLNQKLMRLLSHDTQNVICPCTVLCLYGQIHVNSIEPVGRSHIFFQAKRFRRHFDEMHYRTAISQFNAQEVFQ